MYEIFKLAGHLLPEEQFQYIIHNNKRPHEPEQLRVYDLWQAWLYTKEQADKHQTFSMELIQKINAKVMKHTGKEITTTIGRYDSSLGDFRLEEDYNSVYPIADYTQIPELLNALCRKVNAESQEGKVIPLIKIGIHYLFEFAHIKTFWRRKHRNRNAKHELPVSPPPPTFTHHFFRRPTGSSQCHQIKRHKPDTRRI